MKWNEFFIQVFGNSDEKMEFDQMKEWKKAGEINAGMLKEMAEINKTANELKTYRQYDTEAALANVLSIIDAENEVPVSAGKRKTWTWIAVVIGLLLLSYVSYEWISAEKPVLQQVADTEINTFIKEDGSIFQLADGAQLHALSKQEMKLEGTAHFDIKAQEEPLIIHTLHGDIMVLGTQFNVVTSQEYTEVYMHEGKVRFGNDEQNIILTEGQSAVFDGTNINRRENENPYLVDFWRSHTLVYDNTPLTNVLEDLSRLFSTSIDVEADYDDILISTTFDSDSLNEILKELEIITGRDLDY